MDITREKTDDLNQVIALTVNKDDYQERVDKSLRDVRKRANVNGFRPGKVPMGMIKKMYGTAVKVEEINKLAGQKLTDYLKEEDMEILGEPIPSEEKQEKMDFDTQEEFTFYFDIGTAGEIDLDKVSEIEVPYYAIKATDEEVEESIEQHKKQAGTNEDADEVEGNDVVRGDLKMLDDAGNVVEDGPRNEEALISVDRINDEEIKQAFIGKMSGDVVTFNLRKALPNDAEIASLLNIEKEEAEKTDTDFSFLIGEIKRFKPAGIGQELFDQVYGEGEITSEEEYRQRVKEDIEKHYASESKYKFMQDLREALLEELKPELPENFLKRWIVMKDEEITPDNVDKEFEDLRESIQWEVLSKKLKRIYKVEVTEEEIQQYGKELAAMQLQQYGLNSSLLNDEMLDGFAGQILQNKEQRARIENIQGELKLAEAMLDEVKRNVEEMTLREFQKMVSPAPKEEEAADGPIEDAQIVENSQEDENTEKEEDKGDKQENN